MTPLDYAKKIAYSSEETLMFTYEMAKKYKDSPGVYVECGVAAGAQIIAMAYGAPNKVIYAFDSFEGIPLPSNRDDQMPGIAMLSKAEQKALPDPGKQALVSSGATKVPIEDFEKHLKESGLESVMVDIVPGWFEKTIPYFAETTAAFDNEIGVKLQIAILRLDGDLYNSTYICLKHLFPMVMNGGCVIIDDWTLPGCQAACNDYFHQIGYGPAYKYLDGTAYFYK